MSTRLNEAVSLAVAKNSDKNVHYVDIEANGALTNHRYCEEGVDEPDVPRTQRPDGTFFQHWPYNPKPTDPENPATAVFMDLVAEVIDPTVITEAALINKYGGKPPVGSLSYKDFLDKFYENSDKRPKNDPANPNTAGFWDNIGQHFRTFHPSPAFHTVIMKQIIDMYKRDTASPPPRAAASAPYVAEKGKKCHIHMTEYWRCGNDAHNLGIQKLDLVSSAFPFQNLQGSG
jgi:hypothetical protein